MSAQFPFLAPANPYKANSGGGTPWGSMPGFGGMPAAVQAATKIAYPNGYGYTPPVNNWLTGDPFKGINMDRLNTETPWLASKIGKYQAGQGQLGPTYQYLLGNMGRAFGADDLFSTNDIRNAGLADQQQGAAAWYGQKQALQDQAALGGTMDSGDFGRQVAIQGSQADLAAQTAAADQMRQLQDTNSQTRLNEINSSLADFQRWADNRRRLRMSDAGAGAMVAAGQAQANAASRAGTWNAMSGLFGAGSSLAGAASGWAKK